MHSPSEVWILAWPKMSISDTATNASHDHEAYFHCHADATPKLQGRHCPAGAPSARHWVHVHHITSPDTAPATLIAGAPSETHNSLIAELFCAVGNHVPCAWPAFVIPWFMSLSRTYAMENAKSSLNLLHNHAVREMWAVPPRSSAGTAVGA